MFVRVLVAAKGVPKCQAVCSAIQVRWLLAQPGSVGDQRVDEVAGGSKDSLPALPPRSFRGGRVVRSAAAIQFLQSGVFLSVFSDYAAVWRREEEFGWSRSTLSWAFAMSRAESGLLGPLQGWLIERFGPRSVIRAGAVLFVIGWLLLSQMQNLWHFFAFYFLIAVGASLCGFVTLTSAMVNWFRRRRTAALVMGQTGFAAGGLLGLLVVWWMQESGNWRLVAGVSGSVVGVLIFVLARGVDYRPSDVGEYVDGIPDEPAAPLGAGEVTDHRRGLETALHFTAREAMRTRAFWLISFGHGTALLVVSTFLANRAIYLTEQRGWSSLTASAVGTSVLAFQFIGMMLGGSLGDRIDKRYIAAAAMLGHSAGILLFAHASSPWMVWAFVPLHGISWGARGPLMQALRADYFGPTYFASIMGYSSLVVMFGMMLGGPFAAIIADRLDGNFTPGFTILGALVAFGAIWFLTLSPPLHPSLKGGSGATGDGLASSDD